jgi:hypothetical protein
MSGTAATRDPEFSPQAYARAVGVLYLVIILGGIFAEIFVRGRIVVSNDAAATASNILAHEQMFRLGFAAQLIPLLCNLPLAVMFYELLKVVNRRVAMVVVLFSVVGSAVEAATLLTHYAPLVILKRGEMLGMAPDLLQALTYMAMQLQTIGFSIALTFFGGTCLARGYLIFKSGFLPRFIGLFLAAEGVAYLANSFANFLAPSVARTLFAALLVFGLAEVILCLWLLIRGVNVPRWRETLALQPAR